VALFFFKKIISSFYKHLAKGHVRELTTASLLSVSVFMRHPWRHFFSKRQFPGIKKERQNRRSFYFILNFF